MSVEENKAIARRLFESVWNEGNMDVIDEIINAPEFVDNHYMFPEPLHGTDNFKQIVTAFRSAFPDVRLTIEDVLGEGDKVVLRWSLRGTHQGDLMGIPPTGKAVQLTGMVIVRFSGGKIVERWVSEDALGLMRQLGAIPASG